MEFALKRIKAELLPKYPNVDDVVVLTHAYGCGVAINAPQAIVPIRTLQNLAQNPNFGGEVLVVGLGCEKLAPERLLPAGRKHQRRHLADAGRSLCRLRRRSIDGIMSMVEDRLKVLNAAQARDSAGLRTDRGHAVRRQRRFLGPYRQPGAGLLRRPAGARRRHRDVLGSHRSARRHPPADTPRRHQRGGRRAGAGNGWYDSYLEDGGVDRGANTTPGNKKGGLSNIIEKSLGSIAKSGTSAINAVLSPARKCASAVWCLPPRRPAISFCGTLQLASGMNAACLHHRPRHALWSGRRAGDQGFHPQRVGAALERPDRPGCRAHRHRGKDHRAGRLGAVPADAGCRQRPQESVGRPLGPAQRFDVV